MAGERDPRAERDVMERLSAEEGVGNRAQEMLVGYPTKHRQQAAAGRDGNRVARVIGDDQAVEQLIVTAESLQLREELAGEWQRGERARLDPHEAWALVKRNLQLRGQVQAEASISINLLRSVVSLVTGLGVIAQSKKALGGVALKEKTAVKRPPLLAGEAGGIEQVDGARDMLRGAGDRVPLGV